MFKTKSIGLSLSIFNRSHLAKWLKPFRDMLISQNTQLRNNDPHSPTDELSAKRTNSLLTTVLKRSSIAFLLLTTQLYATNLSAATFTWESLPSNTISSSMQETVSGITATVTSPTSRLGNIYVSNNGGYAGSSGNVIEGDEVISISFSQAVNISNILLIDLDSAQDTWKLSPVGGSNSIKDITVNADSSTTASLNWTNVTSIGIERQANGSYISIDNLVFTPFTNTAPTASSFTASNGPFENLTHTFATSDFGYSDGDGDLIDHLLIEQIPAAGTLYVDANNNNGFESGEQLSNGSTVSKANLDAGNLQYIQNGSTNTSFQFEVNDGTENSSGNYIATLNVTKVPTVTLSINPTSKLENLNANTTVTATLSNTYGANTTVNLGFTGTTTGSGTDYTSSSSSITINAGATTGTVTLNNVNDSLYEQDETVIVDIASVTNGTESGSQQVTYTITNDDSLPLPTISSATYDASTGNLVVTGTNFTANAGSANDVDVSLLTITGNGSNTYTLTSSDVEITNATEFTVTLSANDKLVINGLLNKAGTSADDNTTYNLAAADDFISYSTTGDTADSNNAITVSNASVPTVSSATYDVSTGILTVTGTSFVQNYGVTNDVDSSKLIIRGESSGTYTLTSSKVEITSETSFSITLNTNDRVAVGALLNANGLNANSGTTYNLSASDNWMLGAATSTDIADTSGNSITASNVLTSSITAQTNASTYNGTDGSLTATATGGTPPYSYLWSNGATTSTVTGLSAGNYTFYLTDSIGLKHNRSNIIVTQPAAQPVVTASMTDALLIDNNFNSLTSPGDTLRYTTTISSTVANANNAILTLSTDSLTSLVVGSVTTSQGSVTTGNTTGDTSIAVNMGSINNGANVTITFDVMVGTPSSQPSTISLQGTVTGSNFTSINTNDPDTTAGNDATSLTFDGFVENPVVTSPASSLSTNTTNQTISGTHEENGATISLYADNNNDGNRDNATALASTTVSGGQWSLAAPLTSNTNNNFVIRATDAASNKSADIVVPTITQDATAPSVNSIAISGSPAANTSSVDFAVTFSEDVTGIGTDDFTIDGSGVTGAITAINGSGSSYTVTVSSISGTGMLSIDLNGTSTGITDNVGNAITGGFSAGATHTVDTDAPTVSSIVLSGTPAANANSADFVVTFSENVTGVDASDFSVDGSGVTASITGISGSNSSYTVSVGSISGTGTLSIDLNASGTAITDTNGNPLSGGYTAGATHTVDTDAPATPAKPDITTASDTGVNTADNVTSNTAPTFTGTAEANSTIVLTSSVDGQLGTTSADSSGAWSITSPALHSGAHNITFTAEDAVGNTSTSSAALSITIDNTNPRIASVTRSNPSTSPSNADSLSWQVTFDEEVFNVDATDFSVSGTTASITVTPLSRTVYDVAVSGGDLATLDGTVSLSWAGDHLSDRAGNTLSNQAVVGTNENGFVLDNAAPTLTISTPTPTTTATGPATYTVTYADADSITLANANVSLDLTGTASADTPVVSGTGNTRTVTINNITGVGTIGITIAASTASDNAGNTSVAASSSTDILTNTPGEISISGYTKVGETLTANLVDPDGFTTVTYEWRSGGIVVGSNSPTYAITNSDLGKTITVSASYVDNITSSENVTSTPTSVVLSVKQFALDTISSNANNTNGFLPDENDYQDAGVTRVTPEILALINAAVIRQGGSTDVDSTTEIQTLVDAILEGQDSDGDGLPNIFEGDSTVDSDGDGIANRDDPDADNDGIADAIELASIAGDTDQDGILDAFDADVGNDAIVDDGKTDANFDGVIDEVDTLAKLIEFLINDADGDNYPDIVDTPNTLTKSEEEATPEATSIAPNTQQAFADVLFALMSIDSDDDGIPNYLDLDSDNDTLSDLYEAGFPDFNHDGLIDDGYDVVTDSTHLRDSDRDNIPDFLESKSDGVTFDILLGAFSNDIAELDSNNDGQLDDATDTDGDGVADRVDPQNGFGTNPDTDNDGIANHLDLNNGTDISVSDSGAGSMNTFLMLGLLALLAFKLRSKLAPLVMLVFAGNAQAGNLELTAGIGSSFVDPVTSTSITVLDDKSFTSSLGAGYRFNKNWLVQARYQDLGNAEVGTATDKRDIDIKAYSLNIQRTLVSPKSSPLELYGLIGVAKLDIDAENLSIEDDNPTDLQLGLGLKYTGMKHGFGFIEYTSYNEDMASLMIGVGKKF